MDDLNKSPLTHQVTKAALEWLTEKGFKPVQTEVKVTSKWVADIASVIVPTRTELQDLKLIPRPPHWQEKDARQDWYENAKAMIQTYTCLVEVKTTRADFLKDHKWNSPQPTNLAYLASQKGLISPEEWPAGWGILEFNAERVRCLRPAVLSLVSMESQRDTVLNIAMRIHNETDPLIQRLRLVNREYGDRAKAQRAKDIFSAVCSIVESKEIDFEMALWKSRLRVETLDQWEKERLQRLFGIGKHVYDHLEGKKPNSTCRLMSHGGRLLLAEKHPFNAGPSQANKGENL